MSLRPPAGLFVAASIAQMKSTECLDASQHIVRWPRDWSKARHESRDTGVRCHRACPNRTTVLTGGTRSRIVTPRPQRMHRVLGTCDGGLSNSIRRTGPPCCICMVTPRHRKSNRGGSGWTSHCFQTHEDSDTFAKSLWRVVRHMYHYQLVGGRGGDTVFATKNSSSQFKAIPPSSLAMKGAPQISDYYTRGSHLPVATSRSSRYTNPTT